jgi:hypothetical protein
MANAVSSIVSFAMPRYGATRCQAQTSAPSESNVQNAYATGIGNAVRGTNSHASSGGLMYVALESMFTSPFGNDVESDRSVSRS